MNFPISEYRRVTYKGLVIDDYLVHPSGEFLNLGCSLQELNLAEVKDAFFRVSYGRPSYNRGYYAVDIGPRNQSGRRTKWKVHRIIFDTFPDMLYKPSPLVREFNLHGLPGEKKHIVTETGKEICVTLSVDHVDRVCSNNQSFNLRLATHVEQNLNRGVVGDSKYKGVSLIPASMASRKSKYWQAQCSVFPQFCKPLYAYFYPHRTPNAEKLAALKYNEFVLENLTEVFGSRLGQQIYDEVAYKNVVMPNEQLTLNL